MGNVIKFKHKRISEIAVEVYRYWPKVSPYAKPYLDAMLTLDQVEDVYILDTAQSILLRFLANAQSFRGEDARRIKAEIKRILSNIDQERADYNHRKVYGAE